MMVSTIPKCSTLDLNEKMNVYFWKDYQFFFYLFVTLSFT